MFEFPNKLNRKIAIAISGGADSFALLHMAHKTGAKIIALTVDHQLRTESAQEAKRIAQWCKQNNIEHRTLKWQGEKPVTAIQVKARNARRRLLCAKCKELGIDTLLLGHQADDQAETMLMRLQRGTGLKGLKAMQPMTRDKATGVAILRPLLNSRRSELREYCIENNLPFIDDPSNDNPVFERVRIRQTLSALPELATGIAKSTKRLRRADEALQQIAHAWLAAHQQENWLPALWRELPQELQLRVLEQLCPRLSLSHLEKLAQAMQANGFSGVTFGDHWIRPKTFRKQPGFLFQKAPPRH
jgi:tRNA(Ile)-lysidine synthase